MKRFCGSVFSAIMILSVSVGQAFAAPESRVSAQKAVSASAVIVPAQVSQPGFVISGIVSDIPVKEGDTVRAGQTLMVLDIPESQFAVTEAEAGLRAAQAQAEIRKNDVIRKFSINYRKLRVERSWQSVPHEVIEMADADVRRAQASVQIAEAKLAQSTLTAPFDGVVTSLPVVPGEFISADQAVLTLAALDALQVETTDLREGDVVNVRIGDPASIFVEALNTSISGKVIGISPRAEMVGGDVVFKVTIAPDSQPEGLLWGMTAEVEIEGRD